MNGKWTGVTGGKEGGEWKTDGWSDGGVIKKDKKGVSDEGLGGVRELKGIERRRREEDGLKGGINRLTEGERRNRTRRRKERKRV